MTDSMLNRHLISEEKDFVIHGGIKERMYSARTGYRKAQEQELLALKQKVKEQEEEIARLKELLKRSGVVL